MALALLDDANYQAGMIRDVPSWLLEKGQVYDSLNMLFDVPGVARQRGGSTAIFSGAQTAYGGVLGFSYSPDLVVSEELYAMDNKTGTGYVVNKTTGVATSLGVLIGVAATFGRPVRHFGMVFFPFTSLSAGSERGGSVLAGQTNTTTFVNAVAAQVAAGNKQITLTGADVTTNVKVGALVLAQNAAATFRYRGRVVSVDTAKLFTVWPTPTWTDAAVPIGSLFTTVNGFAGTTAGGCSASFQNRLLHGNTLEGASLGLAPRRVRYSPLPTEETLSPPAYAQANTGANWLQCEAWPTLNFFDVPGADPIIAMEPTSDNELLILTSTHPVLFRGNLVTQLATTSPTITFDISEIAQPAGCLSDLSVQRTKRGIVWAGPGGIYGYDGSSITNLAGDDKNRRILALWHSLASDATLVIHGSAYVRDHYIISGTSGGTTFSLACNLGNLQWTRLSGVGTDNFFGIARPSTPQQVFGLRWWDVSGAAPSMTNGQTVRLDSMLAPYTAGATKADADGTAVPISITTRVLAADTETQKIMQRGTVRYQQSSTTAAVTVTARASIDAADTAVTAVTLGLLSNTNTLTITAATNATPIVCTTATHGLQTDDFVDIVGGLVMTAINGRYRITVLSSTTFSLNGTTGNGVYTASSANVKKVTESDFQMTDLTRTQGVSVTISGSPNNFQLHGIRIAYLDGKQVVSA